VTGGHHQAHAQAADHQRGNQQRVAVVVGYLGEGQRAQQHQPESRHDHAAGAEPVGEPAGEWQGGRHAGALRHEQQPGAEGAATADGLEVQRSSNSTPNSAMPVSSSAVPAPTKPRLESNHRSSSAAAPSRMPSQVNTLSSSAPARIGAYTIAAVNVPWLPACERPPRDAGQSEAGQGKPGQVHAPAGQGGQSARGTQQRRDTDRQVDEEDRPPAEVLHQRAAQHRAEHRAEHADHPRMLITRPIRSAPAVRAKMVCASGAIIPRPAPAPPGTRSAPRSTRTARPAPTPR
jgi:hypothetical protein